MSSMHDNPPKDPLIEAQIDRALAPYRAIATPAMLESMRVSLELMLTTHPVASGLLEQLRDVAAPLTTEDGMAPDESAEGKGGA